MSETPAAVILITFVEGSYVVEAAGQNQSHHQAAANVANQLRTLISEGVIAVPGVLVKRWRAFGGKKRKGAVA